MNREILCRPFPPEAIKQRKGPQGRMLSYVDVAAVITRLNEGCDGDGWSFEVVSHKVEADEVIVLGKLVVGGLVKMAFGGSGITLDHEGRAVSIADDLKAAASDALKKCASLFGVALEMYGGATTANGKEPQQERPADPGDRPTARQLAAIQSICRRQQINREELQTMIAEKTGKSAMQLLTKAEASGLLDALGQNGAAH